MPSEPRRRLRTPYGPQLDLPPPFRLLALREVGNAFAHALAVAAQEGSASAAKLRHAAPDVGANTAQAISAAKYLARVVEAFHKAGMSMQSPLIDRTGSVIGAKSEAQAGPAAMGEIKGWAEKYVAVSRAYRERGPIKA